MKTSWKQQIICTATLLAVTTSGSMCTPTPFVAQKHVRYDFTNEGFLSPHLLQTIGRSEGTDTTSRETCLEQALEEAVRRAVRVMLHTKYEIPPETGRSSGTVPTGGNEFERAYPFRFTERDYVRGLLDYDSLLRKSYLALQDARSRLNCTVVLRIEGSDLPAQIRQVRVTFVPESLKGRRAGLHGRERNEYEPSEKKESQEIIPQ